MKKAEVKNLSDKELQERVDADVTALTQMKINHSITPLDNPAKIKQLRRTIARVKTEIRQRELQTNN
ncbi:MAG: 50S ribosomal protein L29 [Tannerella sp.]|jgi:large subunit ribosomal protein L29|nr:50S ribosomal protein L29 [Tannerella sp.]